MVAPLRCLIGIILLFSLRSDGGHRRRDISETWCQEKFFGGKTFAKPILLAFLQKSTCRSVPRRTTELHQGWREKKSVCSKLTHDNNNMTMTSAHPHHRLTMPHHDIISDASFMIYND
jgi:hypothetical protein